MLKPPPSQYVPAFEAKIVDPAQLGDRLPQVVRPLVFTNGCFDILHRGHVSYLAEARELGATLLVAINSDASVRRLGKGDDRPINGLHDRMAVIAALASVDLVTWFDADTPLDLIVQVRPDVLVKGGDWEIGAIVGAGEVKAWGGVARSIPVRHLNSTTATLSRIRAR